MMDSFGIHTASYQSIHRAGKSLLESILLTNFASEKQTQKQIIAL